MTQAPVWIGSSSTVTLTPDRDITVTAPYGNLDKADLKIRFEGPIPAPITEGQQIGHVEIDVPDLPLVKVPLIAKHSVDQGGFVHADPGCGAALA